MAAMRWSQMLYLVAPHLPGCPEPSMETALAESAAEFCARTALWREELDAELTTAEEHTYEITPSGAVFEGLPRLRLDGVEIAHVHRDAVPLDLRYQTGKPTCFAVVSETSIRFYPTPDAAYTYTGEAVLKPGRAATGLEQFLYEAHAGAIASGAISRLMLVPQKEWTNPAAAAVHDRLFERGVDRARIRESRHVSMRVTPRPFA